MLYQPVGDLYPQILWDTCLRDTEALVTLLRDMLQALQRLV